MAKQMLSFVVIMVVAGGSQVALAANAYVPVVGSCRGDGWNRAGWPKAQGYQTPAACMAKCEATAGCTSFDLARTKNDNFDCFLFNHTSVIGERTADTCFSKRPKATYTSGKGSCP